MLLNKPTFGGRLHFEQWGRGHKRIRASGNQSIRKQGMRGPGHQAQDIRAEEHKAKVRGRCNWLRMLGFRRVDYELEAGFLGFVSYKGWLLTKRGVEVE